MGEAAVSPGVVKEDRVWGTADGVDWETGGLADRASLGGIGAGRLSQSLHKDSE